MSLVRGFERGQINIARLNYAMIILIPKEELVRNSKKFRPISLIVGAHKTPISCTNMLSKCMK
jgi:hypothetical protein